MWRNNVFTDFSGSKSFQIEDKPSGTDSRARLEAGELTVQNNIWWGFKNGNNEAGIAPDQDFAQAYLTNPANNNHIIDPMLRSIDRDQNGMLDPRPQPESPCYTTPAAQAPLGNSFLRPANYIGAFDSDLWIAGWTFLQSANILSVPQRIEETVTGETMAAWPNPTSGNSEIRFSVAAPGYVTLSVYNMLGEKVDEISAGSLGAGNYSVSWNATDLGAGMYIIVKESATGAETLRVVVK